MSLLGSYVGSYLGGYLSVPPGAGDTTAPTIAVSPAAGALIRSDQILTVTITDDVGLIAMAIWAVFPDGTEDAVYDNDSYGRFYKGSVNLRSAVAGGHQFKILRDGGWIGSPRFRFLVVDSSGNLGVLAS